MAKLNTSNITADGAGDWTSSAIDFTAGSKRAYMRVNGAQVLYRDFTTTIGTNLYTGAKVIQVGNGTSYQFTPTGTLTLDFAAAPPGAFSGQASRYQFGASSGATMRSQSYEAALSTQYTVSWYAKLNSGSMPTDMLYQVERMAGTGGTWVTPTAYPTLNTSTWTRVSATFTTDPVEGGQKVWFVISDADAADLLIWGAKLEAGSVATGGPIAL